MFKRNVRNKSLGQTALEYMLVVGVIVTGAIIVGKHFFMNPEAGAGKVMNTAIEQATKTMCPDGSTNC